MTIVIELHPKPPFDFDLTARHMHVLPPSKYVDGVYSRVIRLGSGKAVPISVESTGTIEKPKLEVLSQADSHLTDKDRKEIEERVSYMFSTDQVLDEFYLLIDENPVLKYAKKDMYGLKIHTTPALYEGIVIGYCSQWVSFARVVRMLDNLIRRFGERIDKNYAFPLPEALAGASIDELRECGLGFRAERVKRFCVQVANGNIDLDVLESLPDEDLKECLMEIKWIGPWMSEGAMLWTFKRLNAFPIDVWSAKVFRTFYSELENRSHEDIAEFASGSWGKYRGLAYYYLMCAREKLSERFSIQLDGSWS